MVELTKHTIESLYGENSNFEPIVQVLEIEEKRKGFALKISDGTHFTWAILTAQLRNLILEGKVKKYSLVKLVDSTKNDGKIFILEVSGYGESDGVIGNPKEYSPATTVKKQDQPTSHGLTHDLRDSEVLPIERINMWAKNFTIKAKVARKYPVKHVNTRGKSLAICNLELRDDSGEIKFTCFENEVQNIAEQMNEGGVYLINNVNVKHADKRFNKMRHNFELTAHQNTKLQECKDQEDFQPKIQFSFKEIGDLDRVNVKGLCDVIGVVKELSEMTTFTSKKDQSIIKKRGMVLCDNTSGKIHTVEVALWGDRAENPGVQVGEVLCLRGVARSDFNGVSLNCWSTTEFMVNPDLPEASKLKEWYGSGIEEDADIVAISQHSLGKKQQRTLRPRRPLSTIETNNLGLNPEADFLVSRAYVRSISTKNFSYDSCSQCESKKKVLRLNDEYFECNACNQKFKESKQIYKLSVQICDYSGDQWVVLFDGEGEKLLGIDATKLKQLESSDDIAFKKYIDEARFKENILALKLETQMTPNDQYESRMRGTVISSWSSNPVAESKAILRNIEASLV